MNIDKVTFPNLYGEMFSMYINHTDHTIHLCMGDCNSIVIEHDDTQGYLEAVLNADGVELS
jgi:hypothetical protein